MGKELSPQEQAEENFSKWNEALQTKDPAVVATMYTSDASFLPTVSPEFKYGTKGAEDYFEHFLTRNPEGSIVESRVQSLDENTLLHSGFYNFEVGPTHNRSLVEGRFTFLWIKIDDKWKIAHHHSSFKPKVS